MYDNIRKAVGYVFTIHIPIALSSLLAPLLGISPVGLMLLPLHTVLQINPENVAIARTMGLAIILLSNVFLVQVNSSDIEFAFISFIRLIKDKDMWSVIVGTVIGLLVMLYSPLNTFFKLAPISLNQLLLVVGISFIAVMWYELIKLANYFKNMVSLNLQLKGEE